MEKEKISLLSEGLKENLLIFGPSNKDCPICKKPYVKDQVKIGDIIKLYMRPDCKCFEKAEIERMHKEREDNKKLLIKNRIETAGIPDMFKNSTLKNFKATNKRIAEVKIICSDYAEFFKQGDRRGLILIGDIGTGKTHIAIAILKDIIESFRVKKAYFINFPDFLSKLREMSATPNVSYEVLANHYEDCEFLVIDDFGAEYLTDWSRDVTYKLINNRYVNNLPIIITTNFTPEQLIAKYDYRVISRLFEICKGVNFEGPDYREIKVKDKIK